MLHVVEGSGTAVIDGSCLPFEEADTLAIPTHADVRLANGSPSSSSYLFAVDDAPLQRKIGIYQVFE